MALHEKEAILHTILATIKIMVSSFSIIRKETSQLFYFFMSDRKLMAPITFLWKQINNIKF